MGIVAGPGFARYRWVERLLQAGARITLIDEDKLGSGWCSVGRAPLGSGRGQVELDFGKTD